MQCIGCGEEIKRLLVISTKVIVGDDLDSGNSLLVTNVDSVHQTVIHECGYRFDTYNKDRITPGTIIFDENRVIPSESERVGS